MDILPAVIPESFEDLENHLVQVKGLVPEVQIDICDGRVTPEPSWPFIQDHGELEEILSQQRGMPLWEDFDFEIDLMVRKPEEEYQRWIDAGATRLVFHYDESKSEALMSCMKETKDRGVEAWLALHLNDSLGVVDQFGDLIDGVQLMGIEQIGLQGEPFDERVIESVKDLKKKHPNLPVSVDGGVNMENAERLYEAGADKLIMGSAIFNSFDIKETINYLLTIS